MPDLLVVLTPQASASDMTALLDVLPGARMFLTLPFVVVDMSSAPLDLAVHPSVARVAPLDPVQIPLVHALDQACLLINGLHHHSDVGGVGRGAVYPFLPDQPRGVGARPVIWSALNLSLGPPDEAHARSDLLDPIVVALQVIARSVTPVVAAGNHHEPRARFETVSPWAEPPWVLGVGATLDEAGTVEWEHSARRSRGHPEVGPDVLAWGQDATSADGFGTSFAAARVTNLLLVVRAWLLQLVAGIDRMLEAPFGVPLVGAVIVDSAFDDEEPVPGRLDLPALPVIAPATDAFDGVHPEMVEAVRAVATGPGGHDAARSVLLHAARTGGVNPTLSAPVITAAKLHAYLDNASLLTVAAGLGLSVSTTPGLVRPLFPPGTADALHRLTDRSQPQHYFDISTGRSGARPPLGGTRP